MAIVKKEAYFLSTTGEHKVRCMIWEDDSVQPVAVIQISHGITEHIGRWGYDELARFLASNGFIVCGNDHLGHGKTAVSLEELSVVPKDASIRMVDDMHRLYKIMHKRYPVLPYFLLGHSMGSFMSRVYMTAFGDEIDGVVLCGTGEYPSFLALAEKLLNMGADLIGRYKKFKILLKIFNGIASVGIKDRKTEINVDWISINEENLKGYIADPMCGSDLSLGLCMALMELINRMCAKDWFNKIPKDLPIMIVSGEKDPIGLFSIGAQAAATNIAKRGTEADMRIYPKLRHEILNEEKDARESVQYDILQWLFMNLSNMMHENSSDMAEVI